MSAPVSDEKVLYLLDPGARAEVPALRCADACISLSGLLPFKDYALELPWTPDFLHKGDGVLLSMGQFMQWVSARVQSAGTVQIWPGTPVSEALIDAGEVKGVRLIDQGWTSRGALRKDSCPAWTSRRRLPWLATVRLVRLGSRLTGLSACRRDTTCATGRWG